MAPSSISDKTGVRNHNNKSQGQSLKKVAIWLEQSYFGHGQLYVAASRVGSPENIKFYVLRLECQSEDATRNIVYLELLE